MTEKTTRTFSKEQLDEDFDLPRRPGKERYGGCRVISDEICGQRRWSTDYCLIFQLDDQPADEAWCVYYSCGSTESQCECPWEYEDEIEATLVRKTKKIVEVWEALTAAPDADPKTSA